MRRIGTTLAGIGVMLCAATARETLPASTATESERSATAGAMFCRAPDRSRLFLPLHRTDVHLEVTAGLVRAEVTQQFRNDTPWPLEAVYVFPLPSPATVTGMELRVGDRVIRSVVQERKQAKQTYERAKSEGKKTALLEQERPNIFTTSVANFMPGETVSVCFSYVEAAHFRRGVYAVTFPMVVGPRFIPFRVRDADSDAASAADGVDDAERIAPPLLHPSVDPQHRLSLTADVYGIPVEEITSNTHAIRVEPRDTWTRVTLAEKETVPDSDFNMRIALPAAQASRPSLVTSGEHMLLTVFPPTAESRDATPQPRDVLFLVDTSGSMSGESMVQAKAGLQACLSMLRPEDRFTIVRFADDHTAFRPGLGAATPERLRAAQAYVHGLASGGGTMMQPALEHVLDIPDNGRNLRLVVFLTDGCVGNEDSLMKLLAAKLGRTRLFSFGIGSAPNEFLLRKTAELGRGQARFIRSPGDVGRAVTDLFRTLDEPALTDITLTWLSADGRPLSGVEYFPNPVPDVFLDRPLQVVARDEGARAARVIVRGRRGAREFRMEEWLSNADSRPHEAVDFLFGQSLVNELMYRLIRPGSSGEKQRIEKLALAVALHYQLVTRYTSRVAVEERIVSNPDGDPTTVRVPAVLPKGWSADAFFPTASDEWLWMSVGAALLALAVVSRLLRRRAPRKAPIPAAPRDWRPPGRP